MKFTEIKEIRYREMGDIQNALDKGWMYLNAVMGKDCGVFLVFGNPATSQPRQWEYFKTLWFAATEVAKDMHYVDSCKDNMGDTLYIYGLPYVEPVTTFPDIPIDWATNFTLRVRKPEPPPPPDQFTVKIRNKDNELTPRFTGTKDECLAYVRGYARRNGPKNNALDNPGAGWATEGLAYRLPNSSGKYWIMIIPDTTTT